MRVVKQQLSKKICSDDFFQFLYNSQSNFLLVLQSYTNIFSALINRSQPLLLFIYLCFELQFHAYAV